MDKENRPFRRHHGRLDGAEICEVVGVYILHLIKHRILVLKLELVESLNLDLGLFPDDRLIIRIRLSGHTIYAIRTSLVSLFKELCVGIEVSIDMTRVNFQDFVLELDNGK